MAVNSNDYIDVPVSFSAHY